MKISEAPASARSQASSPADIIQAKFAATRSELSAAFIERDQEIDLVLTALIAGEHALFVGPPGTGKSMLSDAIVQWMDGQKFQILLTKFTTPEEVFGPISLAGLKTDHYRRIIDGKLPTANIAFIDEIWKASSAILNTLLTILNERQFDNDGARVDCPLQLCVAASNEWPGDGEGGQELGALFDRFLLRKHVRPIATERGLQRLLWGDVDVSLSTSITPLEIEYACDEAAPLDYAAGASEAFVQIVREAKSEGIIPGDRRLRKAVNVCKAFAWLNGHLQVEKNDLEILSHVLWDDPAEQPQKLAKVVGKIANPAGMKLNSLLMEAEQIVAGTNLRDLGETATASKKLGEVHKKLAELSGDKAVAAAEHVATEIKRIRLAAVEAI